MPVRDEANIVTLGEGMTPLLRASRLGRAYGFDHLFIKEEGLNPTGTFKARGMSAALSRAKELGVSSVAAPSAGNAAVPMAPYRPAPAIQDFGVTPPHPAGINSLRSHPFCPHLILSPS